MDENLKYKKKYLKYKLKYLKIKQKAGADNENFEDFEKLIKFLINYRDRNSSKIKVFQDKISDLKSHIENIKYKSLVKSEIMKRRSFSYEGFTTETLDNLVTYIIEEYKLSSSEFDKCIKGLNLQTNFIMRNLPNASNNMGQLDALIKCLKTVYDNLKIKIESNQAMIDDLIKKFIKEYMENESQNFVGKSLESSLNNNLSYLKALEFSEMKQMPYHDKSKVPDGMEVNKWFILDILENPNWRKAENKENKNMEGIPIPPDWGYNITHKIRFIHKIRDNGLSVYKSQYTYEWSFEYSDRDEHKEIKSETYTDNLSKTQLSKNFLNKYKLFLIYVIQKL